ncbi:helicase [Candidatus Syntrophocurvum alkaliphilum]|uniref:ATP-dependent RNA helicase CshA n=1 Tax=Candidatus Syntrophocurvum alkaliphilum TaxID=2293317 RepID=A0A6I6DG79_9FIRM|nr:DEAD/DEAH box helicase [Candidatus Syntrophocurvum alkaliphilum]QGT98689.1 helicase [Candidatus Syntrophocurvum alkaliphilum]
MDISSFEKMELKGDLIRAIKNKGFDEPTPIQIKAIPVALEGRDIMGQAQTGTGKTASFGLPILNKVTQRAGLQALVVCPTRELAVQVSKEINSLGRNTFIRSLPIYGGQSIEIQIKELRKKPEIIVSTPGRLLDHMDRGTINLKNLKFVVLDEADEMLDMGFLPDIEKILLECPAKRQTMLFSATLSSEIRELAQRFMENPELVAIKPQDKTVSLIKQLYYEVNPRFKLETLCKIIDTSKPSFTLIFCRTKKSTDKLAGYLKSKGYAANALHGDMSQRERDRVMNNFRKGNVGILVATDIAARGLDVDIVTHVINYDIPEDPDSYVHRIGRTGRAGRRGVAITLTEPGQYKKLRFIEDHIRKSLKRESLPTPIDMLEIAKENLVTAQNNCPDSYKEKANELIKEHDPALIVAAALKLLSGSGQEYETKDNKPITSTSKNKKVIDRKDYADVEVPVGRKQGIYPQKLATYLAQTTPLSDNQIGEIEINTNTSFVEVPMEYIDEVYKACSKLTLERKPKKNYNSKGNNIKKTKTNVQ